VEAKPDAAPVADVRPDPPVLPDKPEKPEAKDKPYKPTPHKVDVKKVLGQARAAEASMQWAEARDAYTRVLESGAQRASALTGLASVAWQTKDLDKTIELAKQAIKAGGGTKARMLLGHAYFKQRDFAAAAKEYDEVLKQHPEDREAQNALSAAKQKGGLP
jgi:tetratricopeptide (TPR) repeat protein